MILDRSNRREANTLNYASRSMSVREYNNRFEEISACSTVTSQSAVTKYIISTRNINSSFAL